MSAKTILDTFNPPAVEPAMPPTNIKMIKTVAIPTGHIAKSVVLYPVVVIIDATWNKECLNASSVVYDCISIPVFPINPTKLIDIAIAIIAK